MGIDNPVHLLFIAVVALVVLGPRRLPELARALGRGIREFRGAFQEASAQPPQGVRSSLQTAARRRDRGAPTGLGAGEDSVDLVELAGQGGPEQAP
jgi:sec-independent protein translocase protein TatA